MALVKNQIEILNDFGFTIVIEKNMAKDKLLGYVIRSNETIPNLRAKYFVGELPGTKVFHRVSYYYEGKKK